MNPRFRGCLSAPTTEGWGGSRERGQFVRMQFVIGDARIKEVAFETFGCVPAIAAASLLSSQVHGANVEEALRISARNLEAALGGLPDSKRYCADIAVTALRSALQSAQ